MTKARNPLHAGNSVGKHGLVGAAMLLGITGCIGAEDPQETPQSEERAELTRELAPPEAVDEDETLGTSIEAILFERVSDSDASHSPMVADCSTAHYEQDGYMAAVYEYCPGSHRRLFIYDEMGELWRVFGDFNDDELVDGWFDPTLDTMLEDLDFDGVTDRKTLTNVNPAVAASFDPEWEIPPVIDNLVLEDTDFDLKFDLETLTAGLDPDGNQTYFRRR